MSMRSSTIRFGSRWSAIPFVLALGLAAGACSDGSRNLTGPSAIGPTAAKPSLPNPTANGNGGDRYYEASVSPTTTAAGVEMLYTVTITNCDAAACDGTTSSSNQTVKAGQVTIPTGFVVNAASITVTAGLTNDFVLDSFSGHVISVKKTNDNLPYGQSIVITFLATAPCEAMAYEFTSVAYNGDDYTTPYVLVGLQPSVTVTGTCATGCTYSQGYWKNHGPVDNPGNQENAYPDEVMLNGLELGDVTYDAEDLQAILRQNPAGGNALVSLAHQLIAAELNKINGASSTAAVDAAIAAAHGEIGSLVIPPIGGGYLASSTTLSALISTLDRYNTGLTGPGHCPDDEN